LKASHLYQSSTLPVRSIPPKQYGRNNCEKLISLLLFDAAECGSLTFLCSSKEPHPFFMARSGIGLAKLQAARKNNNKRMDQSYSPKDL
jgi:hypothetical protein